MEEGAEKWALRDLRREDETSEEKGEHGQHLNISLTHIPSPSTAQQCHPAQFFSENGPLSAIREIQAIRVYPRRYAPALYFIFGEGFLEDGGHDEGVLWDSFR